MSGPADLAGLPMLAACCPSVVRAIVAEEEERDRRAVREMTPEEYAVFWAGGSTP